MPDQWRKSKRSCDTGNCVEFRTSSRPFDVQVRDSKDTAGPVLSFDAVSWRRFLGWVSRG